MKPHLVRGRSGQWSVVDLAEPFDYGLHKVGSHFENKVGQGLFFKVDRICKTRQRDHQCHCGKKFQVKRKNIVFLTLLRSGACSSIIKCCLVLLELEEPYGK